MFFMPLAYFSPQGQREAKELWGCSSPTFLQLFCFLCFAAAIRPSHRMTIQKNSRETIATPPKRGVPTGPDSGAVWHASIPARRGSLSSVFIPAGRLGRTTRRRC